MLATTWNILTETAAFLMLGFFVAGLVHLALSRWSFARYLRRRGAGGVFLASLVGLPLPLCSCSVLPTALTLRKKGASPGATLAFLVSTPETSVPSVLLTYALLGPVMAVVRPIAACVSAVAAGLLGERMHRPVTSGDDAAVSTCGSCDCGAAGQEGGESPPATMPPLRERVREAFHFAFVRLFDDVFGWVLLGILVAAAIRVFVPPETLLALLGGPIQTMVVMVAIGVPLYVCAEASTPVAAVLIAQGVSPGAALVFLLVGPATNIGSLGALARVLGRRAIAGYLVAIILVAVCSGWLLDASGLAPSVVPSIHGDHEMVPGPLAVAATVVFLALGLGTVLRRRLLQRLLGGGRRVRGGSVSSPRRAES